jgi:hypothetical protein
MENDHDHGCGMIGMRTGLICAGLGALIAALLLTIMRGWWFVGVDAKLFVGVAALFVAAGFFGKKVGVYLCRRRNNTGINMSIGIALAFGSIAIAVLAGAVCYVFVHDANQIIEVTEIPAIFLGSLVSVLIIGAIPAAVLGVVYGLLVGMQLERK